MRYSIDTINRFIVAGVSMLVLAGCAPKMHTVAPQIEGRVVDGVTGKPLSGVQVGSKRTDMNGRFIIEGKEELGIGTPMGGVWKLPTVLVPVSKKGYKETYCQCSGLSNNIYGCTNVTIALVPVARTPLDNKVSSTKRDNFSCQAIKREE